MNTLVLQSNYGDMIPILKVVDMVAFSYGLKSKKVMRSPWCLFTLILVATNSFILLQEWLHCLQFNKIL